MRNLGTNDRQVLCPLETHHLLSHLPSHTHTHTHIHTHAPCTEEHLALRALHALAARHVIIIIAVVRVGLATQLLA